MDIHPQQLNIELTRDDHKCLLLDEIFDKCAIYV